MQLRILVLALALSGALALPADVPRRLEDSPSATPAASHASTGTLSFWAAAKRFFSSREKMKAKVSNMPAPLPEPKMDTKYGVSFKTMVSWYCAKEENKPKSICHLKQQGQPDPTPSPDTAKVSLCACKKMNASHVMSFLPVWCVASPAIKEHAP